MDQYFVLNCHLSSLDGGFFFELCQFDSFYLDYSWSKESWMNSKELVEYNLFYSLDQDGHLLGFSLWKYLSSEKALDLLKIVVLPDLRGKGLAEKLLKQPLSFYKNEVEKVFLQVACSNLRAQSFYKKYGFTQSRIIKNFYNDGGSALEMLLVVDK